MCLIGVKEYVCAGEKKKWQKTFGVKFALPYPALIVVYFDKTFAIECVLTQHDKC